jgi:aryl-alcohol dehydrogenase-like predicted oxidoreductase
VELTDALKPLVPQGLTMAQMALRWCLDYPAVTTVIPGAKHAEMAQSNAAVSDLPPLRVELHNALRNFYQERVREQIRGPY